LALTLVLAVAAGLWAQPTTAPSGAESKPDANKNVRLTRPFSELKDLTADETTQLKEIHKKFLEDQKALEKKEFDDEMAVLTDAQKKEVTDIEAKNKAKMEAEHKATHSPATKPAAEPTGGTGG
jgi:hypothetical protein